jgi:hypothetical protein
VETKWLVGQWVLSKPELTYEQANYSPLQAVMDLFVSSVLKAAKSCTNLPLVIKSPASRVWDGQPISPAEALVP